MGWGGGGGANHIVYAIKFCVTPKSRVKQPLLPENGCRFCPLWSEIGYGYQESVESTLS